MSLQHILLSTSVATFVVGSVLLPNRTQELLNNFFAFLISPVTFLLGFTQTFVGGFKNRNQRILQAGGIRSEFTQRAIGSTLLFIISFIALLCDIDLVVLTLQALEIVSMTQNSFSILHLLGLNLSPAELLAMAIIASASAWGILLLDAVNRTTFAPNFLFDGESKNFSRVISGLSVLMVLLSLAILISLAFVRWDALNFDPSQNSFTFLGNDVLFIFIGSSILAFFTSMITFFVAVAFLSVLVVTAHTIFLLPLFLFHLVLGILQQLATLAFNLFLGISNLLSGLTAWIRNRLHNDNIIVDLPAQGQPVVQQNNNPQQVVDQPLLISNEFGNFTDDKAIVLGNSISVNLTNFASGGTLPYNYAVLIQNPQIVAGNINGNILSMTGQGIGATDASIRVTDAHNNIIEYQFSVQVIAANNQAENPEINIPVNPNVQQDNENDAGFNPLNF